MRTPVGAGDDGDSLRGGGDSLRDEGSTGFAAGLARSDCARVSSASSSATSSEGDDGAALRV
jgi:hypothetical protein